MTDQERYQITSNDYADLLIEYNGNMDVFKYYPSGSINYINEDFAILHIPVYNMTQDSISKYGYFSIPTCFGLLSVCQNTSYEADSLPNDPPQNELTGQGVLIGFIDTGIDYTNPVFLTSENTTRILSLWDQTVDSDRYPEGFYYGTEYSRDRINEALAVPDPLSVVPSLDEIGHGTALAGVAAGSPEDQHSFSGIAPDADFLIVKLKQAKPYLKEFFIIPENAICYQENDIVLGVKYLFQTAKRLNRPLVICLGIGTGQSDHTGNRIISRYLAAVGAVTGNAIIVSAGNEGNRRHHYYGAIEVPLDTDNVFLNVGKDEPGFSMQFRSTSPNQFWFDIYAPTGEFVVTIPPIHNKTLVYHYKDTTLVVDNSLLEPQTNTQLMVFRIRKPAAGIWRLYTYNKLESLPMQFHLWLPIQDFISKSTFFYRSDNYTTITAPGNQLRLICSTAYNPADKTLYYYASKGFTINNEPKPDLTAPGVDIVSPTTNNHFAASTGTSISAAYIAGVTALILEWGIVRGHYTKMNTANIKRLLIQGADRDPLITYPSPDWGYGILNITKVVNSLTMLLPNTTSAIPPSPYLS